MVALHREGKLQGTPQHCGSILAQEASEVGGINDEQGAGAHSRTESGWRLVLQLHDELVFEVREARLQLLAETLKRCMEHCYPSLRCPLSVRLRSGRTWGTLDTYVAGAAVATKPTMGLDSAQASSQAGVSQYSLAPSCS
jgi:hypothetical protein